MTLVCRTCMRPDDGYVITHPVTHEEEVIKIEVGPHYVKLETAENDSIAIVLDKKRFSAQTHMMDVMISAVYLKRTEPIDEEDWDAFSYDTV